MDCTHLYLHIYILNKANGGVDDDASNSVLRRMLAGHLD